MSDKFILDGSSVPPELLAETPIMKPPPGVTSNFLNPPSRTPSVLIVTGITVPLILIFLTLRIYIRVTVNRGFGMDDYLCIISAFFSMAYTGLTLAMLDISGKGPAGPHMWDVPLIRITESYLKESLACSSLFAVASITVKTSLLAFFLRLFGPFAAARLMVWIGIVAVVIFYTSYIVPFWVLCIPNLALAEQCAKFTSSLSVAHGIFSTISDFYILLIPLYMIRHLQLSSRHKYSVASVFLTGLMACAASIAGAVYRFEMAHSADLTWVSVPVYATVIAELNIGIICACMPIVFVLFRKGTKSVKSHWPTRFRGRPGRILGKLSGENIILSEMNLPTRPPATISGVRTVVHQVHYQEAPQGSRWAKTYDALASADFDPHPSQDNELRPYDVTITAGNDRQG